MFKTMLLILFFLNTGCAFKPFIDSRREVGADDLIGLSTLDYPAVCYNARYAVPETIIALAQKECSKTERIAVFYKQSKFTCKLFMPHHAIYKCVKP